MTLIASPEDALKNATNLVGMVKLLNIIIPDWTSAGTWLSGNIEEAINRGEVNTIHGKYLVSLIVM